jgi:hypothetical protein
MVLWFDRSLQSARSRQTPVIILEAFLNTINYLNCPHQHSGLQVARIETNLAPVSLWQASLTCVDVNAFALVCGHAAILNLLSAPENLFRVRLADTKGT